MNENTKNIFFISVTDENNSNNRKYSNLVYEMCYETISRNKTLLETINISAFKPHNEIVANNIKKSLFECLSNSDAFIVLLDLYGDGYNPNVWFELGVISTSNKPVILIAKNSTKIPFDINDINVIKISDSLINAFDLAEQDKIDRIMFQTLIKSNNEFKDLFAIFSAELSSFLNKSLELGNPFSSWYDAILIKELGYNSLIELFKKSGIIGLIQNPDVRAEYIASERKAFVELIAEVNNAQESLRTSRFANQSIVSGERKNADVQDEFMEALYAASKRNLSVCDRIVCNNEPMKWNDIFEVLTNSDSKMRVFVRQKMYSIGFELVVVDERVAFIHFYQIDNHGDKDDNGEEYKHEVEIINSTLKIRGESVCRKLADIFDRLHHRDFDVEGMDPSRTLLGIPKEEKLTEEDRCRGVFQLKDFPESTTDRQVNRIKGESAIEMFREALKKWKFENSDDKYIMAVGMCLLDSHFHEELNDYFSDLEIIKSIKNEATKRRKKILGKSSLSTKK